VAVGPKTVPATIANGQTVGAAVDLKDNRLVGVQTPSALTGTTLTFQGSPDGVVYTPVYAVGGGSAYSVTVGTSRFVPVDRAVFEGIRYVKPVSGSAEGGDRVLKLACVSRAGA
jgi:hypothetical protein